MAPKSANKNYNTGVRLDCIRKSRPYQNGYRSSVAFPSISAQFPWFHLNAKLIIVENSLIKNAMGSPTFKQKIYKALPSAFSTTGVHSRNCSHQRSFAARSNGTVDGVRRSLRIRLQANRNFLLRLIFAQVLLGHLRLCRPPNLTIAEFQITNGIRLLFVIQVICQTKCRDMGNVQRTEDDVRADAESWAAEILGGNTELQFVVIRYERERSGGKRYRKDLLEAAPALFSACKDGDIDAAKKIISSLTNYDDSGFNFADSIKTLADALIPRLQRWQVNYDLADWNSGGAMLTLWSENGK